MAIVLGVIVAIVVLLIVNAIFTLRAVAKKDIPDTETTENSITISGKISEIREKHSGKTDAEILSEASEKFKRIFIHGISLFGVPEDKLEDYFDCKVYFSLTDKDVIISKAIAKNEDAENLLKIISDILEKQGPNLK